MAFNPHFKVDPLDTFTAIPSRLPWLPGSVDGPTSYHNLLRVICLLGTACFVCDTSARRIWRRRIWHVMAAVGISLVLFGLVQSAFARPLFLWKRDDMTVPFFATYYYHGNAGSFINLVLPLIGGLAALVLRRPTAHMARSIWIPGFFICVAGAFVNVSRSAIVVTVLICIAMLIWQFRERGDEDLLPPRRVRLVYGLVMIAAVLCLAGFSGWERPAQKFAMLPGQLNSENKRWVATKVCLKMLPDAGWHGFGPGTFTLVFPHYTGEQGKLIPGIWLHAHDDYLQSLLEWGWPASAAWGVLYFGGLALLFIHWRKRRDLSMSDRVLAFTSGLALAGLAIHAFMDFPMQIASLQLYAAVYVGFGWGCARWEGVVNPT